MDFSSLISAVVGGLIVILTQIAAHWMQRSSQAAGKKDAADERIATLALEVVNWFEIDTHRVFNAVGGAMPLIDEGHPIYRLAATIRKNRPDLRDNAANVLTLFRDYYQASRLLLPSANTPQQQNTHVTTITSNANDIMKELNQIVDDVCD